MVSKWPPSSSIVDWNLWFAVEIMVKNTFMSSQSQPINKQTHTLRVETSSVEIMPTDIQAKLVHLL